MTGDVTARGIIIPQQFEQRLFYKLVASLAGSCQAESILAQERDRLQEVSLIFASISPSSEFL